jgi:hypothetical protein
MKRADGWNGRKMSFHTGSRRSQRRLPLPPSLSSYGGTSEFMNGLSYKRIIKFAEPLARRRGSALDR